MYVLAIVLGPGGSKMRKAQSLLTVNLGFFPPRFAAIGICSYPPIAFKIFHFSIYLHTFFPAKVKIISKAYIQTHFV